jgi:RimJ/RimL family protein N-acetyltransferase
MEILTLNSTLEGSGIGSSLVITAIDAARHKGCRRVWFTTTNDNLKSIGFNQRLGFRMVAIHLGVVDEARKVKPQIPVHGERGVRIQDEIVMELGVEPFIEDGRDV